jgi:hypothetical protein
LRNTTTSIYGRREYCKQGENDPPHLHSSNNSSHNMAKLTLVDNRNNKGGDGLFNATDNLAMCDGILSPVLLCKAANNSLIVLPLLIMFHAQQKGEKNTRQPERQEQHLQSNGKLAVYHLNGGHIRDFPAHNHSPTRRISR